MAATLMLGAGALTSCGGDEEEKGAQLSGTAASLVGTWRTEASYGYYDLITLNADGSGLWHEVDLEYGDDDYESFRWNYDEMTRRLVFTFGNGYDSETEVYELISVSGNMAVIGLWDDGELYYISLYRVQ